MLPKGVLSKIGSVAALISLLFLPLVKGCGQSVTGFEVLKAGDIPGGIKVMLIISIACAIAVFFLKAAIPFFITGGGGLGGLLGAYTMARQQKIPVELDIGIYLSIIAFGLILVEGFLQTQKGEGGGQGGSGSDISKEKGGEIIFCSVCGKEKVWSSLIKREDGSFICYDCLNKSTTT